MALQQTLKSGKLRPILAQFVPIHVLTSSESFGLFRQKFPSQDDGGGIPMVAIARADGEVLYSKSGGLSENEIGALLTGLLPNLGRALRPDDAKKLSAAVADAKTAHEGGDAAKALTLLAPLQKIRGSYAAPVVEGEALLKTIVDEATTQVTAAGEKISGDDSDGGLAGAVELMRLARVYKKAPPVLKAVGEAKKEHGKSADAKKLLTYAGAIDKALMTAEGGKKSKAVEQLKALAAKYPGTPVVAFVEAKVAELGE